MAVGLAGGRDPQETVKTMEKRIKIRNQIGLYIQNAPIYGKTILSLIF
jgi:hypothetical protein